MGRTVGVSRGGRAEDLCHLWRGEIASEYLLLLGGASRGGEDAEHPGSEEVLPGDAGSAKRTDVDVSQFDDRCGCGVETECDPVQREGTGSAGV